MKDLLIPVLGVILIIADLERHCTISKVQHLFFCTIARRDCMRMNLFPLCIRVSRNTGIDPTQRHIYFRNVMAKLPKLLRTCVISVDTSAIYHAK